MHRAETTLPRMQPRIGLLLERQNYLNCRRQLIRKSDPALACLLSEFRAICSRHADNDQMGAARQRIAFVLFYLLSQRAGRTDRKSFAERADAGISARPQARR